MSEWPKRVDDWRGMIWACCVSNIGPACNHMRLPDGSELDMSGRVQ